MPSDLSVKYAVEPNLSAEEFVAVLERSGLAARRPVGDRPRIRRMLRNATIIVTARLGGMLVGVSRAITDYAFCVYLSDLAVDRTCQGMGIGRELIRRTHESAGRDVTDLILLAAPEAETYYPYLGLQQFPQSYIIKRKG